MKDNWLYKICSGYYLEGDDFSELDSAWALFYSTHPELKPNDTLNRAKQRRILSFQEYEAIFNDYSWSDGYGGSRWADISKSWRSAQEMLRLGYGMNWNSAMMLIDHIFDLAHNTGSLFTKADESIQEWLLSSLEIKKNNEYYGLLRYVSPDIRRLALKYMRYTGVSVEWYQNWESQRNQYIYQSVERLKRVFGVNKRMKYSWPSVGKLLDELRDKGLGIHDFINTPVYDWVILLFSGSSEGNYEDSQYLIPMMMELKNYPDNLTAHIETILQFRRENHIIGNSITNLILKNVNKKKIMDLYDQVKNWLPYRIRYSGNEEAKNEFYREVTLFFDDLMSESSSDSLKTSALTKPMFFDFYVLTLIDESALPDDAAEEVSFLKKYYANEILDSLVDLLERAVISEARHVGDEYAADTEKNIHSFMEEHDDDDYLLENDPFDDVGYMDEVTQEDESIREDVGY